MANFLVRDLEDDVHAELRQMASVNGKSLEAFVRELLRRAVRDKKRPSKGLGTAMKDRFAKVGLKEGETIPEFKGEQVRSVDFD